MIDWNISSLPSNARMIQSCIILPPRVNMRRLPVLVEYNMIYLMLQP